MREDNKARPVRGKIFGPPGEGSSRRPTKSRSTVLHEILPHGREEIHQNSVLNAFAAVGDVVLLKQSVSGNDLAGLIPDGEAEAAGSHVGDLRVGMMAPMEPF